MEDDQLGAARDGDARGVVEHADRHSLLLVALEVAHEARDRRVDGEDDAGVARELAEPRGPVVVHPELALEVDLAGAVPALPQEVDRRLGALARRHSRRAVADRAHALTLTRRRGGPVPSDRVPTLFA